jgi:predicted RNA binding protein with dsRBD fold (UPF0201 family)
MSDQDQDLISIQDGLARRENDDQPPAGMPERRFRRSVIQRRAVDHFMTNRNFEQAVRAGLVNLHNFLRAERASWRQSHPGEEYPEVLKKEDCHQLTMASEDAIKAVRDAQFWTRHWEEILTKRSEFLDYNEYPNNSVEFEIGINVFIDQSFDPNATVRNNKTLGEIPVTTEQEDPRGPLEEAIDESAPRTAKGATVRRSDAPVGTSSPSRPGSVRLNLDISPIRRTQATEQQTGGQEARERTLLEYTLDEMFPPADATREMEEYTLRSSFNESDLYRGNEMADTVILTQSMIDRLREPENVEEVRRLQTTMERELGQEQEEPQRHQTTMERIFGRDPENEEDQ